MDMNQHEDEKSESLECQDNIEDKEKKPVLWFWYSLQRGFFVAAVVLLIYVLISSIIYIDTGYGGYQRYYLNPNNESYEESDIFYSLLTQTVADIFSYTVAKSQFETDGRFDSQKVIDITAYAHRRDIGRSNQSVTAFYYLGDLIRWAQNGFVYNRWFVTEGEIDAFFSSNHESNIEMLDSEAEFTAELRFEVADDDSIVYRITEQENHLTIVGEHINFDEYQSYGFFINYLYADEKTGDLYAVMQDGTHELLSRLSRELEYAKQPTNGYEILDNFYRSIEGKNIEEQVANYHEYRYLCQNLENAASDLAYNLMQYERFKNQLNDSNIYYVILTGTDDKLQNRNIYTNFDFNVRSLLSEAALLSQIEDYFAHDPDSPNKYIIYDHRNMNFETNTHMSEALIRQEVQNYSYVFPQNTRVWISIDTNYLKNDVFSQGYQGYAKFFPYYMQCFIGAGICFILFFVLLIILSKYTGRMVAADGIPFTKLKPYDRIYTELWLTFALGIPLILLCIVIYSPVNSWNSYFWLANNSEISALLLAGGYAYCFILTFSFFYYGLVRRIKVKNLWEDSLTKVLLAQLRRLGRALKKLALYAFDNPNLLVRFMVPVIGVVILHLIMLSVIAGIRDEVTQLTIALLVLGIDIFIGIMLFISAKARETIVAGIKKISTGDIHHKIDEKGLHADNLVLARAVNSIGDSISTAVEISMRDERMKADLITNVSHDIKTPLTSIINYIDLIKREEIADGPIKAYIDILDNKSQRLKQLTDDLVEASKISSGNIEFKMEKINLTELVNQTIGEFEEKFALNNLKIVFKSLSEHIEIEADSRRIWRVIENLFNNIYKYAMPGTRVYVEITEKISGQIELSLKNISEQPLNFNAGELTERFIRGDISRSTEGSGLGLSIAKSLTEAQNGVFEIQMDGDLFKVMLTFPLLKNP